jgi:hypothetical protein
MVFSTYQGDDDGTVNQIIEVIQADRVSCGF